MASREFDTGLVGSRRASALAMQAGLLVNICTQLGSLGCSLTGSSCSDITSPCALLVPSRASQTAFIHPFHTGQAEICTAHALARQTGPMVCALLCPLGCSLTGRP